MCPKGGNRLFRQWWVEWDPVPCLLPGKAHACHTSLVTQEQPCRLEMLLELRGCNWSCPAFTHSEMSREWGATESPKQTHIKLFHLSQMPFAIQQRQVGSWEKELMGFVKCWEAFGGGMATKCMGCRASGQTAGQTTQTKRSRIHLSHCTQKNL